MSARRIILVAVLALLLFLGIYTWNQRTGQWDQLGANTGLEFSGMVARLFQSAGDVIGGVWDRYIYLMDVHERNDALQNRVRQLELELAKSAEDHAEIIRLRELLRLDYASEWPAVGARILGGRMGSNAALETLMLSRGYLTGARPGTPVTAHSGLVGRVLKAGPSTSIALLITDTGSRVAVVSSRGRVQGILVGGGADAPLEMRFVRQNSRVELGEILVTSGIDSAYPKGIPVARVTSISSGSTSMQEIQALPIADFIALEEVLLLERPEGLFAPEAGAVYTRRPPDFDSLAVQELERDLEQSTTTEVGAAVLDGNGDQARPRAATSASEPGAL